MLENMFYSGCSSIGSCRKPLSGLVLHFSEGGPGAQPCEAAWVGCPKEEDVNSPPVRVYVSPSSVSTMTKVYATLKGVEVSPLRFPDAELDAQAILSMMALGAPECAPLYMHSVMVCFYPEANALIDQPPVSRSYASLEKTSRTRASYRK